MDNSALTSLYPNPPIHYKKFTSENELSPPDINFLSKVSSLMCFGREYKKNERGASLNEVKTDFFKFFDQFKIDSKNIPNKGIFQDPNININELLVENLNIDVFDAIQKEVNFIKRIYKEMLKQISNCEDFELNSCLIKFSFQKIYFFISMLRKKKILIEMINYFNKEINNNTELENLFTKNLESCEKMIVNELKEYNNNNNNNNTNNNNTNTNIILYKYYPILIIYYTM